MYVCVYWRLCVYPSVIIQSYNIPIGHSSAQTCCCWDWHPRMISFKFKSDVIRITARCKEEEGEEDEEEEAKE